MSRASTPPARRRRLPLAACAALLGAVVALPSTPASSAIIPVKVAEGSFEYPAAQTIEEAQFRQDGCATDRRNGTFASVIRVSQWKGKKLELRVQEPETFVYGETWLELTGKDSCDPLPRVTRTTEVVNRESFIVTDDLYIIVYAHQKNRHVGNRWQLWRLT